MKGFVSIVGDNINEREIRKFEEGLNSKVKLLLLNKVVYRVQKVLAWEKRCWV